MDKEGISPRKRPARTFGFTQRVKTGCGNIYITINEDDQGPCEVFIRLGKVGGCASSQLEAIGRLISCCLRMGGDVGEICDQLKGIRCPNHDWEKEQEIVSCSDAVGWTLEHYIEEKKEASDERTNSEST